MRSIQLNMFCSLCERLSIDVTYEMDAKPVSLDEIRQCRSAKVITIKTLDSTYLTVYVQPLDSFLVEREDVGYLTMQPLISKMRTMADNYLSTHFLSVQ